MMAGGWTKCSFVVHFMNIKRNPEHSSESYSASRFVYFHRLAFVPFYLSQHSTTSPAAFPSGSLRKVRYISSANYEGEGLLMSLSGTDGPMCFSGDDQPCRLQRDVHIRSGYALGSRQRQYKRKNYCPA